MGKAGGGRKQLREMLALLMLTVAPVATQANPLSLTCEGGAVWNECGSPCTRTCQEPNPMCIMMCVAKCECPGPTPFLKDGQCISKSMCSSTLSAAAVTAAPACIPNPLSYKGKCVVGTEKTRG